MAIEGDAESMAPPMNRHDFGLPPEVDLNASTLPEQLEGYSVRATRLTLVRARPLATEIWVGGAHAAHGSLVGSREVRAAWILDLAGDLPPGLVEGAARHVPKVFQDIEAVPHDYDRLRAIIEMLARSLEGEPAPTEHAGRPLPVLPLEAPERLYVMCKQGLNRSALAAGLLLRALGVEGAAAVRLVREQRPGALSNVVFEQLILA
jgi:hypothetical protein